MTHTVAEKAVAKRVATKLMPIGPSIDKLNTLREDKRAHEAQIKLIEEQYNALEAELMGRMDQEGVDKSTGKTASVSITSTENGNLTDWDAFSAYVVKNKFTHLFQRRLSDPALREIWAGGKPVPGVEKFIKKRLNLRAL